MGKLAYVFPGQGAQAVGMGKDIYEIAEVKMLYENLDLAVGFALSDLIFSGPEDVLKSTVNTQPALLTTSLAYLEAFRQAGGRMMHPDFVAGHSLGEWTALTVAGSLSAVQAASLVHKRGQFMEAAVPSGLGAMAAVLGADRNALQQLCTAISEQIGLVELANLNCPGQIVVSGTKEGVAAVLAQGKEAGAKRVIPLEVSGPFHSSMMQPAAIQLAELLKHVQIEPPSIPLIANTTAERVQDAELIRSALVQQVRAPVLWEDSIALMISLGVDTFVEFGPGAILSGLIKKIDRNVQTYAVNSAESAVVTATQLSSATHP
jgi:[acyl-carrier-protein] S-malonyltransferase